MTGFTSLCYFLLIRNIKLHQCVIPFNCRHYSTHYKIMYRERNSLNLFVIPVFIIWASVYSHSMSARVINHHVDILYIVSVPFRVHRTVRQPNERASLRIADLRRSFSHTALRWESRVSFTCANFGFRFVVL